LGSMSAPIYLQVFAGLAIFALAFAPLERLLPAHRQRSLRPGWTTDILYYVVGCFVGHISDSASLTGMIVVRHAMGFSGLREVTVQPAWLQFPEIVLIADFLAYWLHRFLHRNRYLWRLHRVHHSSEHMDWLANVRLHPLDKFMGDCFQFVPIFCIGFSNGVLLAYTVALGIQGFLNHSNIRLNYGPLRWIIANPHFHHWHHCNHPQAYDRNFAPHLVIFDLLFGTALIPPERSMPKVYGVREAVPAGFWGQMIYPFLARDDAIAASRTD